MVPEVELFFRSTLQFTLSVSPGKASSRMERSHYFKIGELAHLTEMSPRTIRYYQEIGLLHPVKRVEGGKRVFYGE